MQRFWFVVAIGIPFFIAHRSFLYQKLLVRVEVWAKTVLEIIKHPWIGWGFDNGTTMNTIYSSIDRGITFRQSDWLNFSRDVGLVIALLLAVIIYRAYRKVQYRQLWFSCTVFLIGSCIQTNTYFACMASIGIILFALLEKEKCQKVGTSSDIVASVELKS